jgi:hypothetical protein
MLAYCRSNKGKVHFLVVFNLTRFARDKYDHFVLRSHLKSLGISLRSATEPIDETSTWKLMEGVLAAFAQFDNDVRSDRTRAGMKEALQRGRWTFLAPLGYLNAPRAMRQSLIPDPERAAIVRRLFKQYATGTYTKQQILRKPTQWGLTNRGGQPLTSQAIGMLLRNRLLIGSLTSHSLASAISDEPCLSEMTSCELAAGSGLQVFLKGDSASLVGKLHDHVDDPRSISRGVRAVATIVSVEPFGEVGREPCVVPRRCFQVLQDVDDSLRLMAHAVQGAMPLPRAILSVLEYSLASATHGARKMCDRDGKHIAIFARWSRPHP